MLIVGLTGGIGSGKSTVSAGLAARGARIIDADAISRELQTPGQPVLAAMVARFGADILQADGTLDRAAVARRVFGDADAVADLNAIVHPAVGAEIARRLEAAAGSDDVVILDVPLLLESGRVDVAGVVVVDLDPEVAVARLVAHRGFDAMDARARIAHQLPRAERLARADLILDNHGSVADLDGEVARCWCWIEGLRTAATEVHGDL